MMHFPRMNIQPGEIYLAREPMILKTILGSCVAVTFWSKRLGAGALCHGVLPRCPPGTKESEGHRYVDYSIRYLTEQFCRLGARVQELEVKVFGGADVLPTMARSGKPTIGALNCQIALEVLEAEGLRVLASDLGGTRGRTIEFNTSTGGVLAHRLARLHISSSGRGQDHA
jgi:chemotaxis protein CheD